MHCARSGILHQGKNKASPWLHDLLAHRLFNVAVAALTNKLVRTIWALVGVLLESGDGISFPKWEAGHIIGHENGGVSNGLVAQTAYLAPPLSRSVLTSSSRDSVKNLKNLLCGM